jgi:oligoribonuclease
VKQNELVGTDRHIVWIDCEMTGLRINADTSEKPDDEIIEIGVIVTDGLLNPLDAGMTVVIAPTPDALAHMNSFVRTMHTSSGLLAALSAGVTLKDAEDAVLEYITKHVPAPKTAQVGGNTVLMDRIFLAKYMPRVDEYLHYRSVDVSAIKELTMRWFPDVYAAMPEKTGNHRALADAIESIRELDYYRNILFRMAPKTADELAAARDEATMKWSGYLS